ncbi:MAG: arginase family protein [Chitinophagaceae bacterium]
MKHFNFYHKEDIPPLTKLRRFETKLGEKIQFITNKEQLETSLQNSTARFVIFGIPEDIGVKANIGMGGADSVWEAFLSSFLNIQSSDFLDGEEILLLGYYNFNDIRSLIKSNAHNSEEEIAAWRHAVNLIDEEVESLVKLITSNKKIPVSIGGGQNNAYPLIKGSAKGLYKAGLIPLAQINCLNLDSETDYRPMEGRHSGNSFRYADEDGYLQKYCVVGVHENDLPQNVWIDIVNNPFVDFITYEDIFIHEKRSFLQAVADAADFTDDTYTGIELDLNIIENVLSNDISPSGISALHARQYINFVAKNSKCAYLNISEGAIETEDGRKNLTAGKLVSFLVADFIKALS